MYDGLEIDMLSVGCADCILVTKWNNGIANRVLVDGACKSDYENVIRPFLRSQNIVTLMPSCVLILMTITRRVCLS
jgi:hypothetical protein